MRQAILIIFLVLLPICFLAEIIDFVPANYDFFIIFKDNGTYYPKISSVQFFNFLLGENGLGLEYVTKSLLENIGYNTRVSPDIFYEAISKNILFASKGVTLDVGSFFSVDLNYYVEALRNIGTDSILVFETDKPEEFIKLIAGVTNLKVSTNEKTWILQDTDVAIFARYHKGYIVLSGSKSALEKAIDVYDRPTDQFSNRYPVKDLINQPAWICGFFKGNSFSTNLAGIDTNSLDSDYFTVTGIPNGESLVIEVKQYLKKSTDLNKYLSNSATMRNMPFIGNFAFSVTASGPSDIAQSIASWFQGAQEEVRKIYQIISSILEVSTGRVYLTGDISSEQVRFAAIFNLATDFDMNLIKSYGARDFGGELRLPILNGFVSFFTVGKDLIVTNMTREDYQKASNRKRLRDDAAYQYLSKKFPEKDMMRIYVDLGNIVESMLGSKARGRVLFSQFIDSGVIIYRVEVM
ncbi:hypothetical protein [Thermotoga profunda]|uniref:hypothetical protein n=1 Tax=Thermotoga profunda TaxID=1508420 RepID=UPI0005972A6E|nr:hypothetical protein [Thermotoga profunda]